MEAVLEFDAHLRQVLASRHAPWLDAVTWTLSAIGVLGGIWAALAAVTAAWVPRLRPAAWQVVMALLLSQTLVDGVLKPGFARARPFVGVNDVRVVGYRSTTHSFPSGHATSSFAAATVFAFAVRRSWPCFALAAAIAISRIYVGVHYPLDIIGGTLLGVGLGILVTGGRAWYSRGSSLGRPAMPR